MHILIFCGYAITCIGGIKNLMRCPLKDIIVTYVWPGVLDVLLLF